MYFVCVFMPKVSIYVIFYSDSVSVLSINGARLKSDSFNHISNRIKLLTTLISHKYAYYIRLTRKRWSNNLYVFSFNSYVIIGLISFI